MEKSRMSDNPPIAIMGGIGNFLEVFISFGILSLGSFNENFFFAGDFKSSALVSLGNEVEVSLTTWSALKISSL